MNNQLIEMLSTFFSKNPQAEGIYVTATLGHVGSPNDLLADHVIGKAPEEALSKLNVNFQILFEDNRDAMEDLIEGEVIEKDDDAESYCSEDEEAKISGYIWATDFT